MGVVNSGEVYEAKQRSRPQLKKPSLEASVCNALVSQSWDWPIEVDEYCTVV